MYASTVQVDSLSIYLDSILALQSIREDAQAIEISQKFMENFSTVSSNDSLHALWHHRVGISYYRLRNRTMAIKAWENAIAIRKRYLPHHDLDIIKTHINIANAYLTLRQNHLASQALDSALILLESQSEQDQHTLGRVYESLGLVAHLSEDFQASKDYLVLSRKIKEKLFQTQPWRLIDITTRLFDVSKDLEEANAMLTYAKEGLEYVQATAEKDEAYWSNLANAYNNLGIAYEFLQQPELAIKYYQLSISLNETRLNRKDFVAITHNNLVGQYLIVQDYDKALQFADKAIHYFRSNSDYQEYLAESLVEKGKVLIAQDLHEKAEVLFNEAIRSKVIEAIGHAVPGPNINIIGSRRTLMDAMHQLSICFFAQSRFDEATMAIDSLHAIITHARNQISDRQSRQFLSKSSKQFYETAIALQLAKFTQSNQPAHVEKALAYFESSKANLLYDALLEQTYSHTDPTLRQMIDRERSLYQSITNLTQANWSEDTRSSSHQQDSIAQYRLAITRLRDSIWNRLLTRNLVDLDPSSITLTGIRSQYLADQPGRAILQYFVGDAQIYAVYLDHHQVSFQALCSRDTAHDKVERFLRYLKEPSTSYRTYQTAAGDLYAMLMPEIVPASNIDQLLIIPDGIIGYIPFEVLINSLDSTAANYKSAPYLLHAFTMQYAPSLSTLALQQESAKSDSRKDLLGMAMDYQAINSKQFPWIRDAVREVEQIQQLFGGEIYVNEQATKSHFLKNQADYRILHLSLHGIVDPNDPGHTHIQFTAPNQLNLDTAKLYAAEVYSQKIPADLVVLSACETGSGQISEGDGILSLAYAFAYAGARSTLMNLWQVSAHSSRKIIQGFYQQLAAKKPQHEALKLAKLSYLQDIKADELAHPFYWAALTQYGDINSINQKRNIWWLWCLIPLIILYLWRRSNNNLASSR